MTIIRESLVAASRLGGGRKVEFTVGSESGPGPRVVGSIPLAVS